MILQSRLLEKTVRIAPESNILFLNSAADPFVSFVMEQCGTCTITLAEDNVAALQTALQSVGAQFIAPSHFAPSHFASSHFVSNTTHTRVLHAPFHEYALREAPATMDVAVMNLLYQPSNAWMLYGLRLALYALKPGGKLYVVGAKDRGILTIAKRMQALFGNIETLEISKGFRVVCSHKHVGAQFITPNILAPDTLASNTRDPNASEPRDLTLQVFAHGTLDEGTRLLLEALDVQHVRPDDEALDIGCGAGIIGLHIAKIASEGHVTMVDASLAAVAVAKQNVTESGLSNIRVLPSDGAQAVLSERFDLVVTNPPFHLGGMQTTAIAERFIREAAQVLRPHGRFYLVANRFLKYEPILRACFRDVREIGGDKRYKVLCGMP
jgi:16S rRNA (guanine1207-N2)-methyltransferase